MADRNTHLNSSDIRPYSHFKAWWSCSNCPDGHPHIWEAVVASRSGGIGCPYCSGKAVCRHNSLATKAPATVQYWHKEKNLPLSPETLTAGSHFRAHWMCPVCEHEWQCRIGSKVKKNSGCPKCAKAHSGRSKDGTRQKHPTLADCNSSLLSQWDYDLNAREGNYPDNTRLWSDKWIWWTCDQCPAGNKHVWPTKCYSRTKSNATGCPFCSHQKACDCNSLQSLRPKLAADFNTQANGLTADQVTAGSTVKYR